MSATQASKLTTYLNTDRENFQAWKRDIDAFLSAHPDKLLSVVTTGKMASVTRLRFKAQCKQLGDDWDSDTETDLTNELDTLAYHIILPTIQDKTTLTTIERKYSATRNARKAYEYVCDQWRLNAGSSAEHISKDKDRAKILETGAKSASLAHMTEFVEAYLDHNAQLSGTDFHHKNSVVISHVLAALAKHDRSFVSGFKGARAGEAGCGAAGCCRGGVSYHLFSWFSR